MKAISLMYHDVTDPASQHASGFPTATAAHYKLDSREFRSHLESIARVRSDDPTSVICRPPDAGGSRALYLTFDDGGISALHIADALGRYGWIGHFFVTTDFIGTPGFLMPRDIRELKERGHVVGSHSCSHPSRMSRLIPERIFEEWRKSARVLSEIVGERISVASVPGGDFSLGVAQGAAAAGISGLFTSEPTMHVIVVEGCMIIGRYAISRGMSPEVVASIAVGKKLPRALQFAVWNLKKTAKIIGGEHYLRLRRMLFEHRTGL